MSVELLINGKAFNVDAGIGDTLLSVLREKLDFKSAKRGCNQGVCGACTVSVDGWPMRGCLSLAVGCAGKDIRTLEGLSATRRMQFLQEAFVNFGAFQCGFCTPGMLVAADALLARELNPSHQDVKVAMSGNLCRCTGYLPIVAAVRNAAERIRKEAARG